VALPEHDGFWAITGAHTADHWRGGQVIERVPLGSAGVEPLDPRHVSRLGDLLATVGVRPDGSYEATVVRLGGADPGVLLTVDLAGPGYAHPTPGGGCCSPIRKVWSAPTTLTEG
jgi:hypothetical protein